VFVLGGTVTVASSTLSNNTAVGGAGGAGGTGGPGFIAAVFGSASGTVIITGGGTLSGFPPPTTGGATAINTGGLGGNGGNGALGQGGGFYVNGGAITLVNDTLAGDTAQLGLAGSAGRGGHAGTGLVTGGLGVTGSSGNAQGGGVYIRGGTLDIDNSTVAANSVASGGAAGGLDVVAGTVLLQSTIVAKNTDGTGSGAVADNIAGTVLSSSSYNLIGTGASGGLTGGSNHNQVNVADPGLGTLAANGGPTETIALQGGSPAIAAGSNPEKLFADQRGYGVPAGTNWDVGAYQTTASADVTPPSATLQATDVNATNAASLNPYTFTITFSDGVAVSKLSLSGAVVQVDRSAHAPMSATVVSTSSVGSTDALGNAQEFVVTYKITPPGGAWSTADNGTYTVMLLGAPVTDLAGNSVPAGPVGSFSVQITIAGPAVISPPPGQSLAGSPFGTALAVQTSPGAGATGFNSAVTTAPASGPAGSAFVSTPTVDAVSTPATVSQANQAVVAVATHKVRKTHRGAGGSHDPFRARESLRAFRGKHHAPGHR
jgi:hypothetical protein